MKRLLAAAALLVSSCTTVTTDRNQPVHIVFAQTTDVHGNLEAREIATADGQTVQLGGVGLLGGYLRNLRRATENVVLVDSGDMWQGTLISNTFEGESVIVAYNALRYDAVAIGNHEFDYGPAGAKASPKSSADDPVGALRRNISMARFPFLSANIRHATNSERPQWLRPYTIVERGGVRVALIGAITIETPSTTLPPNVAMLRFTDAASEIATIATALRRDEQVSLVVVIAHVGTACRDTSDPFDNSSCNHEAELFPIAKALPPGSVDAIFGGHSHGLVRHFVNGIAIAQAPAWGRGLSLIDFWVDPSTKSVLPDRTVIRPPVSTCQKVFDSGGCDATGTGRLHSATFEGRTVVPDIAVTTAIERFVSAVESRKREILPFTLHEQFPIEYHRESAIGGLVADSLRAAVPEADFGIINSGGIRTPLSGPQVTFGEMFAMLPFENYVTTVRLTGAQLEELFQRTTGTVYSLMQVSGLRVTADLHTTPAQITLQTEDGRALDPNATYTVASVDFLTSGGEGLAPLTNRLDPASIKTTDLLVRDALIAHLQNLGRSGPIHPGKLGRWTIIKPAP